LGVKLGAEGAVLSPAEGRFVKVAAVRPPGDVLDTTGAGDAFYAGLVTGLLREMDCETSGRLAAAAGACCVTGVGTTANLRNFEETARLAGIA
jgi:2-dehydro-3-deoxygluconokinase